MLAPSVLTPLSMATPPTIPSSTTMPEHQPHRERTKQRSAPRRGIMEVLVDVKDHILGGWHSILDDDHARSKWMSTTASHEWAIWETARRLVSNRVGEVCVGSVAQRLSCSRKYCGTRMIGIDAVSYLHERGYRQSHERFRCARSSPELLWYGRIFPKDISHVEYWTLDVRKTTQSDDTS